MSHTIDIYSDGSATTKEKPGGWAWVMVLNGVKHFEGSGHMPNASNNDAELESAIQGLAAVLKHINESIYEPFPEVTLVSDSQIILGWAGGTYRFKQADKLKKYEQLQFLVRRLNIKTRWVKGHSGDEHNERCDKLAKQARLGEKKEIPAGDSRIGTKKTGTVCLFYKDKLKIVDLSTNIVEDYSREIHGPRGGIFEVREEKSR